MAHIRRKFYDLMEAHQSPIATEAIERISSSVRSVAGLLINAGKCGLRVPGPYLTRCTTG